MTTMRKISGIGLAAAAAAMFLASPISVPAAKAADVHCAGINACKGQSECKAATNSCKGQNACKGHGWVTKASAEECTTAGGTVVEG